MEVLLKLGEGLFNTQITAQNYLTFLLHTTVPLAVLFEFPVVVSFLTSIGILTPVFLTRYRPYAYFVLLVLAVDVYKRQDRCQKTHNYGKFKENS